jgi:hypothetical protein
MGTSAAGQFSMACRRSAHVPFGLGRSSVVNYGRVPQLTPKAIFEAARAERRKVSGKPARHDDPGALIKEHAPTQRPIADSLLP